MSKTTLRKRIALTATTALFAGMLSVASAPVTPEAPAAKPVVNTQSITATEYADHMQLSVAQLETVTLMLQVLEQTDGGLTPTE